MKMRKLLQMKNKMIDNLQMQLFITRMFCGIMTVLCCFFAILLMTNNNNLNNEIADSRDRINILSRECEALEERCELLTAKFDSYVDTIYELFSISEQLDEQNIDLVQSNQEYFEQIVEYQSREELHNRYEYAIYDEYGNRTDITFDQLVTLQDLIEDSHMNDEDLILAIIMTESRGIETASNSSSSAKGYGQFIDGTSRFVYTDLLERSGWTSTVALDGDTNIEMMVAYFDYLYEQNNGNLYDMLRSYRGKYDINDYVARIDFYLASVDKSVYDIYLSQTNDN